MRVSPLQLKEYFLTEVSVRLNEEFVGAAEKDSSFDENIEIAAEIRRGANPANKRDWKVDLKIRLSHPEPKRLPYEVQIGASGIFAVAPNVPDEFIERLVSANAPAVLYGGMREVVAQLTRRGPNPALLLPSVTFVDDKPVIQEQPRASATSARRKKAAPR